MKQYYLVSILCGIFSMAQSQTPVCPCTVTAMSGTILYEGRTLEKKSQIGDCYLSLDSKATFRDLFIAHIVSLEKAGIECPLFADAKAYLPAAGQTPDTRLVVYQEYYVRQGDTLRSIAVQFRVSADELALVNNKQVNESLIAGQRILIPKY